MPKKDDEKFNLEIEIKWNGIKDMCFFLNKNKTKQKNTYFHLFKCSIWIVFVKNGIKNMAIFCGVNKKESDITYMMIMIIIIFIIVKWKEPREKIERKSKMFQDKQRDEEKMSRNTFVKVFFFDEPFK